jgi:glucose-6-phosphate 1-epimerase
MDLSIRKHSAGFSIYTVSVGDSEFELSEFGGQLLSWTRNGVPILFANKERAILDGKAPYRGGAPICFPYFGKGALLPSETLLAPQHGHARTTVWHPEMREAESAVVLRTTQPAPDGFGPTSISCELTYSFGDAVSIGARVVNVGEKPSPFQLAIHCYWACERPSEARIHGLGERFLDNLIGLKESRDADSSGSHIPPFDRVYPDAVENLELITERFQVNASTQNCSGAVIWNPGVNHRLSDLGSPDFICLESGVVAPYQVLDPGKEYRFQVEYRADLLD